MSTCAMTASTALTAEHAALLAAFLAEERARRRRERCVELYVYYVPPFLAYLEGCGTSVRQLTLADAYAYQGTLIESRKDDGTEFSKRTIANKVMAASVFCAWLESTDRILYNPFKNVRRVRLETTVPDGILKESQMHALLDVLAAFDKPNLHDACRRYRVHVVAELQYASGLRIAEMAALRPEDVDLDRALVYVKDGKHGSNRVGFLTDCAVEVLALYMERALPLLANDRKRNDEATLFRTNWSTLDQYVNEEVAHACAEAGVPVITSHGFRHALGYHLLRAGCSLRYIQAILGHKNIKDTETYTKVDVADVKRVFDACHPRMRL